MDYRQLFDRELRKQHWNIAPSEPLLLPCSDNPLVNAAISIAACAFPQASNLKAGGKADRYARAMLAHMLRLSRTMGDIERLPKWASDLKTEAMNRNLVSGSCNFQRALTIRDLITSATVRKDQHDRYLRGERSTFTLSFSPDLLSMNIEIPFKKTTAGYILSGKIPNDSLSSLRAAILYHRLAFKKFDGPAVKLEIRDDEYDYQNIYTRYVRPSLFIQNVMQVVWEAATRYAEEARERDLPIDEILMRKAEWAKDIHIQVADRTPTTIFLLRELGITACWCKMVHFRDPLSDS